MHLFHTVFHVLTYHYKKIII